MRRATTLLVALALFAFSPTVRAQESTFTPGATQPSAGRVITKHLISFDPYIDDPTDSGMEGHDLIMKTTVSLGITGTISATLEAPFVVRQRNDANERTLRDLGDLRLELKYRFWQHDPGPVDTLRLALRAGVELPTGTDGISSEGVDPYLGVVFMSIIGRHGFTQSFEYLFTTDQGDARFGAGQSLSDALRFDTAYLYRLAPDAYQEDTAGSLYAMVEFNGVYETNGDVEAILSPGLLWEARNYALEAAVRFPVYSDLDHRPERGVGLAFGIRFLF